MEWMDPAPAILAVAAVFGLALWWLRRKGALGFRRASFRRTPRRLETIERLALAPQHALYLVRVDDRAIVVAQSPGGIHLLDNAVAAPGRTALRATAGDRG